MDSQAIREALFARQDLRYRDFQIKLIPTVRPETVIGVRTPDLRRLAGEMRKEGGAADFLAELPHAWFEENQLHAFLLSARRDFKACLEGVERFLPFVDNWATCDQMSPRVFRGHRDALLPAIRRWMASGQTYTARYGVKMLMDLYLDEAFDPAYPGWASALPGGDYYVDMAVAWYFATALAKQYEAVLPFFTEKRLPPWTHNRAIQKALESRRIPEGQKAHLRALKLAGLRGTRLP